MGLRLAIVIAAFATTSAFAAAPPVPVAEPFPLSAVRLTDPDLLAARETNANFLRHFDVDRILWSFRRQAGVPHPGEPLHGWEHERAGEPGAFQGHYLSACAEMYAATGELEWKDRVDAIVAGLAECQQRDGYLAAYPESAFDHIETTPPDGQIPYYALHKVMAGLYDAATLANNAQARDVLEKMTRHFSARVAKLPSQVQHDDIWPREFGGMNEVGWDVFGLDHSPDARRLATFFDQESFYDPLARGEDQLDGLHANTQIPKVIGAARRFEITGDDRDHDVAEFFWHTVVNGRTFVTGGTCVNEHWHGAPGDLADELSFSDQETCTSYNLLKLTRHLFGWQPRAELFDYYERDFYNSILGSQDPVAGTKLYHLSLKPGGYKLFGDLEDSLWCCFGTGLENFAKIGDSAYFRSPDDRTLWVNLFMASTLTWAKQGVTITQATRFPNDGETTLTVNGDHAATFSMRVRVPSWTNGQAMFAINDSQLAAAQPREDGYLDVTRTWQPGDRLRVRLPMRLHVERMPDDANVVAIMVGPIVLAGQLSDPMPLAQRTVPHKFPFQELRYEQGSVAVPALASASDDALIASIKPVAGQPLTFTVPTTNGEVTLAPLSRTIDRHYTVYWQRLAPGTPQLIQFKNDAAAAAALEAKTVDRVDPSEFASEVVHEIKSDRSRTGRSGQTGWRDAAPGGWFSYRMNVDPAAANTLACTYFADERLPRTFEVRVDDQVVGRQTLGPGRDGMTDVRYAIPASATQGKRQVVVSFRGVGDSLVGGVWGVRVIRG